MESASLSQNNLHRLDAFQANCLRKIFNLKATFYTEVLNPTATTTTNQDVMQLSHSPTISNIIQSLQMKFLGHILRGTQEDLCTQVCFTGSWIYRGGLTGDGLRKGLPKQHWIDQATSAAWTNLTAKQVPEVLYTNKPISPSSHLTLHRLASNRTMWREVAGLPTCIEPR